MSTTSESVLTIYLPVQLIGKIANRLNLRVVSLVVPTVLGEHDIGHYVGHYLRRTISTVLQVNGTRTGLLGYIQRRDADTVCFFYNGTPLRSQHFDLSDILYKVRINVLL